MLDALKAIFEYAERHGYVIALISVALLLFPDDLLTDMGLLEFRNENRGVIWLAFGASALMWLPKPLQRVRSGFATWRGQRKLIAEADRVIHEGLAGLGQDEKFLLIAALLRRSPVIRVSYLEPGVEQLRHMKWLLHRGSNIYVETYEIRGPIWEGLKRCQAQLVPAELSAPGAAARFLEEIGR